MNRATAANVEVGVVLWVVSIGGTDFPVPPFDFVPQPHSDNVDVTRAPQGEFLGPMLQAGEIDALISAVTPQCVLKRAPQVAQLFPDCKRIERDYYLRTGIFPITHILVVRKQLLAQHPGLAQPIYRGFRDAKDRALQRYHPGMMGYPRANLMVPWFGDLLDENRRLFPDDWWPYGLDANRKPIDTFLRYHFEQGLSQ
jgi:4,5-dihydroxyphthalate decarboxylase